MPLKQSVHGICGPRYGRLKQEASIAKPNKTSPSKSRNKPPISNLQTLLKQDTLLALMRRPDGADIKQLSEATGWQSHSVRGAISGGLKKKLGLAVRTERIKGRGTVYKLDVA